MATMKALGSKLYSDTVNANFFICQCTSQYRFNAAKKWDLVIVDEIRSVLNQGTSTKTNKQNLKMNNDCIRLFMKNAEKTVLLDAHLEYDSMVKDFIEDLYKPSELLVCRYDQNPMKRTIVHYDGDMVSMLCKIRRVLAEGKRIICVFRSKKEMHTVKDQISAMKEDRGCCSF